MKSKTVAKNENEINYFHQTCDSSVVVVKICVQLSRLYVFPLSAWCTGAEDDAQTLEEKILEEEFCRYKQSLLIYLYRITSATEPTIGFTKTELTCHRRLRRGPILAPSEEHAVGAPSRSRSVALYVSERAQ